MLDQLLLIAQQAGPQLNTGYDWFLLASRILHILGAIILVGGLFYLWAVVSPIAAPPGAAPVDQYFGGRRAAWAKWIGIASLFLLVTGFWNYFHYIRNYELAKSYHMFIGMKMLAGIALMFLAAVLAGRSALAETVRQKWRVWLNVCLLVGIIIVVLGSVLRTYPRPEKLDAPPGPTLIAP
jgi:putative copper export protein